MPASISLPAMLQTLFGYDALSSRVSSCRPPAFRRWCALIIAGVLLGRGVDCAVAGRGGTGDHGGVQLLDVAI